MNCDEVQARFDDLVDGKLSGNDTAAIEDHLHDCEPCSSLVAALRELRRRTAELTPTIEPPRDLWPGIAARIEDRKVVEGRLFGLRLKSIGVSAAVAAVLIGAVVIGYLAGRQDGDMTVLRSLPTVSIQETGFRSGSLTELTAEYDRARTELLAALDVRRGSLSSETQAVVDHNLRVIDRAIEEITVALANDPGNLRLSSRLAAAYQLEIDLLQRANRLPAET
jgi:predicted anti-sigma-YlaC factor YlaD